MKILDQAFQKINYKAPEREITIWALLGIILYLLGRNLDFFVFSWLEPIHNEALDEAVIFFTEKLIFIILGLFGAITVIRVLQNPHHKSKLVPAFFALMTAGILAFVLKSFFAVPRPFLNLSINPMVFADSFSFPSAHTAVAFALLIPFWRISKWLGASWCFFAIFTGFARIYENVHYPSDIAGGIFLGGVVGAVFSHPEIKKLIAILWEELEFRRQSFHFLSGFLCVFAHWIGFLRLRFIGILLILGFLISLIAQYRKIPIIASILTLFDRPRDKKFPGRGAFFFLMGVGISFLIFPIKIAYAAILILAVGDSLNHLFTAKIQKVNLPWNRRKNIWGLTLGIFMGTIAAQFFVPWSVAIIASTVALIAETISWKIGKFYLDDNLTVPLIAGSVLWWLL